MNKKQTVAEFFSQNSGNTNLDELYSAFCNEKGPAYMTRGHFNYYYKQYNDGLLKVKTTVTNNSNTIKSASNVIDLKDVIITKGKHVAATIDPALRIPLKTNTAFDVISSKNGGPKKNTVYIVTGESGAGKTTVCTNVAEYIKMANENVTAGFISAEMNKYDWDEECNDNPRLGELDIIYLLQYIEADNYIEILESCLGKWDFVVLDSFEVIVTHLTMKYNMSTKEAENKLLTILNRVCETYNNTIFVIQQYTKGGVYVGSTKIKHLTTGLIYVMMDEHGKRFLFFEKNRRGGHMIGTRLYFTKNKKTGMIEFDSARLEEHMKMQSYQQEEEEDRENKANKLDNFIESMRVEQGKASDSASNVEESAQ